MLGIDDEEEKKSSKFDLLQMVEPDEPAEIVEDEEQKGE